MTYNRTRDVAAGKEYGRPTALYLWKATVNEKSIHAERNSKVAPLEELDHLDCQFRQYLRGNRKMALPICQLFRKRFLLFFLTYLHLTDPTSATELCRSKSQSMEPKFFELHSCAWCFQYLARSADIVAHPAQPFLYVITNKTSLPAGTLVIPDISNTSHMTTVCGTVSSSICERWQECCTAARECCSRQMNGGPSVNGSCGRTWDGWSCWDDTEAGSEEYVSCPGFLQYSVPSGYGKKTCLENGTWFSKYQPNVNRFVEWTDYTTCIDKQRLMTSVYLALGCNGVSILFLVPALVIFLVYRSLRRQHRIRLHINFFGALLLSNVMSILWDVIVTHDRLTNDSQDSTPVMYSNGEGCKILAFLRLYFKSTTYVWMFCEGFYLHRLISNAFRPPKSLMLLYCAGWGVPLFYTILYVILRAIYANDSCWAKSFGHLEWIVYCPNLLCLIVNLFFLCNILRVLLTQLQSHPNEPSNFRRALKATFVLIPLFGVQLFVTIYRLPAGQLGSAEYEQFTVFVINSQGFFVALIFCFFNGEVLAQTKRTCTRLNLFRAGTESSRGSTLATSFQHRDDSHESENGGHYENFAGHSGSRRSADFKRHSTFDTGDKKKYAYIPMRTRGKSIGGLSSV